MKKLYIISMTCLMFAYSYSYSASCRSFWEPEEKEPEITELPVIPKPKLEDPNAVKAYIAIAINVIAAKNADALRVLKAVRKITDDLTFLIFLYNLEAMNIKGILFHKGAWLSFSKMTRTVLLNAVLELDYSLVQTVNRRAQYFGFRQRALVVDENRDPFDEKTTIKLVKNEDSEPATTKAQPRLNRFAKP